MNENKDETQYQCSIGVLNNRNSFLEENKKK